MYKKILPLLGAALLCGTLISGCASKNSEMPDDSVTLSKVEYENLQAELAEVKNDLQKQQAACKDQVAALETKVDTLETEKAGEKILLLFDGKIKYTVEASAVMDYEEMFALAMNSDPEFKETIDKGGRDADLALIGLLKKISPEDRKINGDEIRAFLQK